MGCREVIAVLEIIAIGLAVGILLGVPYAIAVSKTDPEEWEDEDNGI